MRKIILLFICCAGLILSTCKKDDLGLHTTTSKPHSYAEYGFFMVSKSDTLKNGNLIGTNYIATAAFSCVGNTGVSSLLVPVDSIRLNGNLMLYSGGVYHDTASWSVYHNPPQPITFPYTFTVVDDSCIPSFSFTENGPYPTINNYSTLPDTVYKNNDLTISLSGISNYDFVGLNIIDVYGRVADIQLYPPLVTSATSVTIPVQQMTQFQTGTTGFLQIYISNTHKKTFSSKAMSFLNSYTLTKAIFIK